MKKVMLWVIVMLVSVNLFGFLPQTKTINETLTENIRAACDNDEVGPVFVDSPIMQQYYLDYKGNRREDETEAEEQYDDIGRGETFLTGNYLKQSFLGVIDVDLLGDANDYLFWSVSHLLDPSFEDPDGNSLYLSLEEVFEYFAGSTGASTARRGLDFGYILDNVTFIVDMLWEYTGHGLGSQTVYHDSLTYQLRNLAEYANWLLTESRPNGNDPGIPYTLYTPVTIPAGEHPQVSPNNYRIRLAAILGYAGCVLDSTSYIDTAIEDLIEYNASGSIPNDGYYNLNVTNSGVYEEGMNYTNYTAQAFPMFFNSYKRMGYDNLYEEEDFKEVYENSMALIMPDFNVTSIDDAYFSIWSNPYFFSELIPFYYQSTSENEEIEWFLSNHYNAFSDYPDLSRRYKGILSYNPNRTIDAGTIPSFLANGSYSTSEFTFLRNPVIGFNSTTKHMYDDEGSGTTLIVNHENSLSLSSHEHSDQSSFQLYYKGKQLLTDPGYRPDLSEGFYNVGKEWLLSPFAHNLIIVNPDTLRENSELTGDYWDVYYQSQTQQNFPFKPNLYYEPVGDHGTIQDHQQLNPCYKDFLIINNEIEHLKIKVVYDHQQARYDQNETFANLNPADNVDIERSFYSLDNNSYYIIYDYAKSVLHNESNTFCNQLHFAVTEVDASGHHDDLYIESDGSFSYEYYESGYTSDIFLHGVMGSQTSSVDFYDRERLPQGVFPKELPSLPEWEHRDLRLFTETTGDEQFLTLLIPSENDTTPINDITPGSGQYVAKYSLNTDYNCYAAVSDGNDVYCDNGNTRFVTDASFLLVEANNTFADLKKLILMS